MNKGILPPDAPGREFVPCPGCTLAQQALKESREKLAQARREIKLLKEAAKATDTTQQEDK